MAEVNKIRVNDVDYTLEVDTTNLATKTELATKADIEHTQDAESIIVSEDTELETTLTLDEALEIIEDTKADRSELSTLNVAWSRVTSKPDTYPPENHTHYLKDLGEDTTHKLVTQTEKDYIGEIPTIRSNASTAVNSDAVKDTNYTHTDNNFTTSLKNQIGSNTSDIETLSDEVDTLESDVSTIKSKIPSEATDSNKLADKSFVNSSIATATATFRGTYDSVDDLDDITVKDLNDYAFIKVMDSSQPSQVKQYDKYKYNGSAWVFEYTLNNSSFTSAQWNTINSGLTSTSLNSYSTTSEMNTAISNHHDSTKENTSNKVTSISSSSTNNQYPTAKAVYDYIQSLDASNVQYPLD